MEDIGKLHCIPGIHILSPSITFIAWAVLSRASFCSLSCRQIHCGHWNFCSRFSLCALKWFQREWEKYWGSVNLGLKSAIQFGNFKSKTEHVHTYAYACIQLTVTKPNYARIPPLRLNCLHQTAASAICGDDKTLPPTRPESITLAYPSLLWPTVSSEAAVQKLQGKLSNCNVTSLCIRRSRQRSVLFNAYWNKRSRLAVGFFQVLCLLAFHIFAALTCLNTALSFAALRSIKRCTNQLRWAVLSTRAWLNSNLSCHKLTYPQQDGHRQTLNLQTMCDGMEQWHSPTMLPFYKKLPPDKRKINVDEKKYYILCQVKTYCCHWTKTSKCFWLQRASFIHYIVAHVKWVDFIYVLCASPYASISQKGSQLTRCYALKKTADGRPFLGCRPC